MTDEHDAEYDDPRDDAGLLGVQEPAYEAGRRRGRKRRSLPGCLAVLLALAIIVGGFYVVVTWGIDKVRDQFDSAEDYPGPGRGNVTYQVVSGATAGSIGRDLKAAGVVASVDAFVQAANASPDWADLQAGYFALKKQMAAADAVEILVDPANMVKDTVTIPEGLRVVDIVGILAKKTDYPKADFEKVLDNPGDLGLPSYAEGNPEGYLFPATYDFGPDATPESMLTAMVTRWKQAAEDADLEAAAAELGYTPAELMTVASLVQAEGRGDDMPKIARVIYNRVENPDNGVTNGLLQVDASVNYALERSTIAVLTQAEIDSVADSPYNTYTQTGLPPAPIEAPGDDAIEAAAHPADGDWLFYVTVNLRTGETKFTEDYQEFLGFKQELQEYCDTQSDRC
ncbi:MULTISPECIES: endolytic transglycosylase MltG [unclassified Nocardioides]|uniref:endolytic transglycosylase MltG n=1 Tax=unclassified Nocardioides TaxID=2615069 RepID=UPI000056F7F4|nr:MULTISPECIES: endolytic transglycosylase MltG [unclassified Nocardioides]ABL81914.1 aminodeoxychorismate lyase [Nocardioides sp. JS614]